MKNYEHAQAYKNNIVTFQDDGSIELRSGFFYNILDLNAGNYDLGRYPYVYYGNFEKYKTQNDSLFIYSKPYKTWRPFKVKCVSNGMIELISNEYRTSLLRIGMTGEVNEYQIRELWVHVFEDDGGAALYKVNYKAKYTNDDMLSVEVTDSSQNWKSYNFELSAGSFKAICKRFANIDLTKLQKRYPTEISERTVIHLKITFQNNKVVETILENRDYPEELHFALIPVLYGHQQFVYSHFAPIDW